MPRFTPEKFIDFVVNYRPENLNQKEGILKFASEVHSKRPDLFRDEADWVMQYRASISNNVSLRVPYFSQRDNFKDPERTCFSSSCAMLLEFLKPGTLPGTKGDDKYIQRVFSIGDTTKPEVQIQALKSFNLSAKFILNGTFSQLDSQLKSGKPVPIGILHKGPSNAPTGGGHWIIVIGREESSKAPEGVWYIVHDPWGEINNSDGQYISTKGESLRYSKSLLSSRWTVEGDGSGYSIIA